MFLLNITPDSYYTYILYVEQTSSCPDKGMMPRQTAAIMNYSWGSGLVLTHLYDASRNVSVSRKSLFGGMTKKSFTWNCTSSEGLNSVSTYLGHQQYEDIPTSYDKINKREKRRIKASYNRQWEMFSCSICLTASVLPVIKS